MDKRKSLIECGITRLHLGGALYEIFPDKEPGRGGTCLVYFGQKIEKEGVPRKVIIKEFYPVLEYQEGGRIKRFPDGSLLVPEALKHSEIYIQKKTQFLASYERFKCLFNDDVTNNYVVQGQEIISDWERGTAYMVVDYSSGITLSEYMKRTPSLYDFIYVLKKTVQAADRFHKSGYIHLDLKPENILVCDGGYVKIMDVDSMVQKETYLEQKKQTYVSVSDGYTAPEVISYDGARLHERQLFARRGETADIYSVGALLYAFLYKEPLYLLLEDELRLDRDKKNRYLKNRIYEVQLVNRIMDVAEDCPRKVVRLIRDILRGTLTELSKDRIPSMEVLLKKLDEIYYLLEPGRVFLCDSYYPNARPVFGRDGMIREIEEALLSQRSRGGSRIVVLSGIGGIGKSTLARYYAGLSEENYDVIAEVTAKSAKEALLRLSLFGWKDEEDETLTGEAYFEAKTKRIKKCMREQKTLLLVHDYDVSSDETFVLWKELGCDILLTSRNDWSKSGIPTIQLKTEDLSPEHGADAAKQLFLSFYLENAKDSQDEEWEEKLIRSIEREEDALNKLLFLLDYHPLGISLMAKQMAYFPGAETKPSEVVGRMSVLGLEEYDMLDFQHEKDHRILDRNVHGHLQWIYKEAMESGFLLSKEREALKYMTLIPPGYGVSLTRYQKWTGLSPVWLESLKKKGWLEFYPAKKDVLSETAGEKGVYMMPMVISELVSREGGRFYLEELEPYFSYAMRGVEHYSGYEKRKAQSAHQEKLILRMEENETEEYAVALEMAAHGISVTDGSASAGRKCIHLYESIIEVFRELGNHPAEDYIRIYNKLSAVYYEMKDLTMAASYAEMAMELIEKSGTVPGNGTMVTILNLGTVYWDHGENEKALSWQQKALTLAEKMEAGKKEKESMIAECYVQLGYRYYRLGEWAKAENYLADACEITLRNQIHVLYSRAMQHLARLQRDIRDYELSVRCYEVVYDVRRKVLGEEHNLTKQCKEEMADVYLKLERYQEAFRYDPSLENRSIDDLKMQRDRFVDEAVREINQGNVAYGLRLAEEAGRIGAAFLEPDELKEEYLTLRNLFERYGYWGRKELYDILAAELEETE